MHPSDELLPVLVADLDDREAREVLDAAAASGGQVWVPLETAPVNAAAHILEVHTRGAEPLFYICEPVGPPTNDGFPLRIRPVPNAPVPVRAPSEAPGRDVVRGRRSQKRMTLSESHTKDLSYMGPLPTEDAVDPHIGRALAGGKLLIEQLIGQGGVGAVYKARHRELQMPVAVKVLHESFQSDIDFCRRFYAEALGASRLDHPNITRVIDFGQEPDGQLYFAMEFLDGEELRAVLEKERKLSTVRIVSILMQVCAGLSHAHARGLVHRDIKPENLVLVPGHDDDGRPTEIVKVCDFGIALHRGGPAEAVGFIAGTPEYMSPEQCRSEQLDARSDIYSCGVVLYELVTGTLPFTAERPAQLLNKHQFTPPVPPSKIEPSIEPILEGIILKALAKEPSERYASMRDFRADLRKLLEPTLLDGSPAPGSVRDPRVPSKRVPSLVGNATRANIRAVTAEQIQAETAKKAAAEEPAWLERGGSYGAPTSAAFSSSVGGQPAAPAAPEPPESLAQNALAFLKRLAQTPDAKSFAPGAQKLEGAIPALAQRGEVEALWMISSTMHGIAQEGQVTVGSRAWSAAKLLRVFDDPNILALVAEHALNGPNETRDKARRLLANAGVAGAYGLYGARVKLARVAAVRPLFVTMLKEFGGKGWPVIKASLEKIAATTTPNPATLELAEDLLLCVPGVGDESAGHVVVKFLRWPHSAVCRAAAATIIKLWGDRAKPLFVAMVQSKEDVVRVAGIAGLRQLGAVDEHLVPRLETILTRQVPAGDDVRAAAAIALGQAAAPARQRAVTVLAMVVKADPGPDAVVLAAAKSLLAIGGASYRALVVERAERSDDKLRTRLRGALETSPAP